MTVEWLIEELKRMDPLAEVKIAVEPGVDTDPETGQAPAWVVYNEGPTKVVLASAHYNIDDPLGPALEQPYATIHATHYTQEELFQQK